MFRSAILLMLVAALVTVATTGCARTAVIEPQAAEAVLVWPPRPAIPRVQYLHSISSAEDIDIKPGVLQRIIKFVKGDTERRLARPHGLTVDAEGRLYVVDTLYQRVHVFDRTNATHYLFPNRPPEGFENPIDVAVGTDGRVYVSDSVTNVIHVFSAHGKRYVGSIGEGRLARPTGLVFDTANNRLIVTDTRASSLVVFDANGLDIVAVVGGEHEERFHFPTNVTLGMDDHVLVTDALNFRVQVLNRDFEAKVIFGSAGDGPGYFSRPKGVAVDSDGHIYVVDALFGNIQIFDADGALLLAFGKPGNDPGEFWLPNDIFIDDKDRIYVSDAYNHRVQVFQYLSHADGLR